MLLDVLVWLAVIAALMWLAIHYFPQLRDVAAHLPSLAHHAAEDVRTWWNGR